MSIEISQITLFSARSMPASMLVRLHANMETLSDLRVRASLLLHTHAHMRVYTACLSSIALCDNPNAIFAYFIGLTLKTKEPVTC